jgi:hypothetical protein
VQGQRPASQNAETGRQEHRLTLPPSLLSLVMMKFPGLSAKAGMKDIQS